MIYFLWAWRRLHLKPWPKCQHPPALGRSNCLSAGSGSDSIRIILEYVHKKFVEGFRKPPCNFPPPWKRPHRGNHEFKNSTCCNLGAQASAPFPLPLSHLPTMIIYSMITMRSFKLIFLLPREYLNELQMRARTKLKKGRSKIPNIQVGSRWQHSSAQRVTSEIE